MPAPDVSRLLVTGATGFVGRHVLADLASAGRPRPVAALLREPAEWERLDWTKPLSDVRLVRGSLSDVPRWQAGLPPLSGILHLAAPVEHSRRAPETMRDAIVDGTLALVRLAAEAGCRLVVASTSGTVGCTRKRGLRADENAPFVGATVAGWPYYAAKIEMEQRARALATELRVDLVFVRPPILLGPDDHRMRSVRNVQKFLQRKMPVLIYGGMHFADVRDAAKALVRAVDHPEPRPIYHLDGTECEVIEFFAMLEEISGVRATRLVLPYRAAWLLSRALERFHLLPDPVVVEMAAHWWGLQSRYAAEELDWKPRSPQETLRDTVAWLRSQGST